MPTTRLTCLDLDDPFGIRRRPLVAPDAPARTAPASARTERTAAPPSVPNVA